VKLRNLYLLLTVAGFILPNLLVAKVSVETGNFLLWLDPRATVAGMFGNEVSAAFVIDLLVVVAVFFYWSYQESRRLSISSTWQIWLLTLLFGMAGSFPLFLYRRQVRLDALELKETAE